MCNSTSSLHSDWTLCPRISRRSSLARGVFELRLTSPFRDSSAHTPAAYELRGFSFLAASLTTPGRYRLTRTPVSECNTVSPGPLNPRRTPRLSVRPGFLRIRLCRRVCHFPRWNGITEAVVKSMTVYLDFLSVTSLVASIDANRIIN